MAVPDKISNHKKLNLSLKEHSYLQSFQLGKKNFRKRPLKTNNVIYFEDHDEIFRDYKSPLNYSPEYKTNFLRNKRNHFVKTLSSKKPILIQIPSDEKFDFPEDNGTQSILNSDSRAKAKSESLSLATKSYHSETDYQEKLTTLGIDGDSIISTKDILINSNYLEKKFPEEMRTFINAKEQNVTLAQIFKETTYINCDLRYFNLNLITQRIGYFDVILADPPWRLKGGQKKEGSFMFSNSRFKLDYDTLSDRDIMNIRVDCLSEKGFCFLWVLNSLLNIGYECLNKWGYEVVEQIIWVKQKNNNLYTSQGYYFLHSFEICLVGYKCPSGQHVNYKSKVSSNIIFSEVNMKSKKPEALYKIIEQMFPGSKKIELFARNHNLREGWFSLGNQLGINYEHWYNKISCNNCKKEIKIGIKRYKSKLKGDYDICETCFLNFYTDNSNIVSGHRYFDFFQLNNNITDEIHHDYFVCNHCQSEPIYGLRFHCETCENFDLCESCFDKEVDSSIRTHNPTHKFICFDLPEVANGLAIHLDCRCSVCYMKPVIGPCFECLDCKGVFFCQNCYFNAGNEDFGHFGEGASHRLNIRLKEKIKMNKIVKCDGCRKVPIVDIRYKCDQCYNFNLCKECYGNKDNIEFVGSFHKGYHSFTCFYM